MELIDTPSARWIEANLTPGDVLYARVYFTEARDEYKVRPTLYVAPEPPQGALVRPCYSNARPWRDEVWINRRKCFADTPTVVLREDVVGYAKGAVEVTS